MLVSGRLLRHSLRRRLHDLPGGGTGGRPADPVWVAQRSVGLADQRRVPERGDRPRFTEENAVDRNNLSGLIDEVRDGGINPVFVIMPLHPSFLRVHEPATSRNQRLLESLAEEKGVDVLHPLQDYSDASLFTDGHHLSPSGAAWFSADIAPRLRPYLSGR